MKITYLDKVLTLKEEAYITGSNDDVYYLASATDADGNDYLVRWEIIVDDVDALDDESDACDWDVYTVIAN